MSAPYTLIKLAVETTEIDQGTGTFVIVTHLGREVFRSSTGPAAGGGDKLSPQELEAKEFLDHRFPDRHNPAAHWRR